ncbi:hypothetical protein C1H21_08545 [Xanthomonas arboricola pv. juglandis]|nr:hypothetical protein C1H21_08545 [Xanthomonas arboricola pv. juglandis]
MGSQSLSHLPTIKSHTREVRSRASFLSRAVSLRECIVSGYLHVTRCLIPGFDGALFSLEWKEALWARFCMGAPPRQRRSVERYSIVKRA